MAELGSSISRDCLLRVLCQVLTLELSCLRRLNVRNFTKTLLINRSVWLMEDRLSSFVSLANIVGCSALSCRVWASCRHLCRQFHVRLFSFLPERCHGLPLASWCIFPQFELLVSLEIIGQLQGLCSGADCLPSHLTTGIRRLTVALWSFYLAGAALYRDRSRVECRTVERAFFSTASPSFSLSWPRFWEVSLWLIAIAFVLWKIVDFLSEALSH